MTDRDENLSQQGGDNSYCVHCGAVVTRKIIDGPSDQSGVTDCDNCGAEYAWTYKPVSEASRHRGPHDFDRVNITIHIKDEIVTDREYSLDAMLTEEEIDASEIDPVEDTARRMFDDILHEYKRQRDGDESG